MKELQKRGTDVINEEKGVSTNIVVLFRKKFKVEYTNKSVIFDHPTGSKQCSTKVKEMVFN
jgi:2-phospho-L-lactate guanylyltransferase (CobY/MobA/RfbA family)